MQVLFLFPGTALFIVCAGPYGNSHGGASVYAAGKQPRLLLLLKEPLERKINRTCVRAAERYAAARGRCGVALILRLRPGRPYGSCPPLSSAFKLASRSSDSADPCFCWPRGAVNTGGFAAAPTDGAEGSCARCISGFFCPDTGAAGEASPFRAAASAAASPASALLPIGGMGAE